MIEFKNVTKVYNNNVKALDGVNLEIQSGEFIFLVGPSGAGKSTFIKSVIVNILFAQTICVASAEHFKMTPFRMIETYLHIPDSKGSQSLFEAEMYRSRDYLERLKELDSEDFSFIVLDEIFSSTNYIEGFSGAYAILKKIGNFQNTLSMTTTHYSDLEKLEKDTKGRFEKAAALDRPLQILVDRFYIRQLEEETRTGPGRSPSPSYEANPQIFEDSANIANKRLDYKSKDNIRTQTVDTHKRRHMRARNSHNSQNEKKANYGKTNIESLKERRQELNQFIKFR